MFDPVKIKLARKQLWKNELDRMEHVEDVLIWWVSEYDKFDDQVGDAKELVMKRLRVIYRKGNTKQ